MIAVLIILAVVAVEAGIHWYIIEKRKKDPKSNDAFIILRTLFYIGVASYFAGVSYVWTLDYILQLVYYTCLVVLIRWALFDYALNLMRPGKSLFYLGNVTIDDKIEAKLNNWLLLAMKLTALGGGLFLLY